MSGPVREPKFTEFTVREHADGGWEVVQEGKSTGQLCMGEMLEMVVKLAEPGTPGPRYAMKTDEQWAEDARLREERYVEGLQR